MKKHLLLLNFLIASYISLAQVPVVSAINPTVGTVGTSVTITGSDFDGVTAVTFGGTAAASFIVESSTIIRAVVASGASGVVSVTSPEGTATIAGFAYADNVILTKTADGAEPSTNAQFRIGFPEGVTSSVSTTVNISVGGTASPGTDFTAIPGSVVIPAGSSAVNIDIEVLADQQIEGQETVSLEIISATNNEVTLTFSPAPVSATIDDDPSSAVVSVTKTADGAEPSTNAQFRIGFPEGVTSSVPTTVNISVGGTASPGTDFTAIPGSVVIPAGSSAVNIDIEVLADQQIEGQETVSLEIISATNNEGTLTFSPAPVSATIDDDPSSAVVSVTKTADGAEPSTNAQFRIGFPEGVTSFVPTTVNFSVRGTATPGTDFSTIPSSVVIPAGSSSVNIDIEVLADQLIEVQETVTLEITSVINADGTLTFNPTAASANIDDNLSFAVVTLTKTADGAEPSTDAQFRVSFPDGITGTAATDVVFTIAGTATNGVDYTAAPVNITIPAGSNFTSIDIPIINDFIIEGDESLELTLVSAVMGSRTLQVNTSDPVSAILQDDDDNAVNSTVSLTRISDGGEGAGNLQFQISFPAGVTRAVPTTVNYSVGGQAVAGVDFTTLSGSATISAGSNSVVIDVSLIDDQVIEGVETVSLLLTSASDGIAISPATPVSATIADNDDTPSNKTIVLSKLQDGAEAGADPAFRVSFPSGITLGKDTTVLYETGGSATSGIDFTALSGSVTISAGSNSADIEVTVINDAMIEATETITLALQSAPAQVISANIVDDDNTTPNNTISLVKIQDAAEPSTNARFRVGFPAGISSSSNTVVNYSIGGNAVSGSDYAALSGSVTIPAGTNSADINVAVIDDKIIENNETVAITLTTVLNSLVALTFPTTALAATIVDDDNTVENNTITLTKVADGAEPVSNALFRVSFPAGFVSSVSTLVNYVYATGGTATPGADYMDLPGSVTIPAGANSATIDVSVLNDQVIEGIETIALTLSSAANGLWPLAVAASEANANIADDDNLTANTITLTKVSDGSETGSNARFAVSFPPGLTSILQTIVRYSKGGSATAGVDYTTFPDSIVIPPGVNSRTFDISVMDDRVMEGDETIELTLTSATNLLSTMTVSPGVPVTAVISDDDITAANSVITLTKISDGAEPAINAGFNVSFPPLVTSSVPVTVRYSVAGTAVRGVDYVALSDSVIIPAGQNSADIEVTVIDDQSIEISETVAITLVSSESNVASLTVRPATSVIANIADDENVAPNTIILSKVSDGVEGGTNASFRVGFPTGITSSVVTVVNYTIGGTAANGVDYSTLSGTLIIPAGSNSVTVPVAVTDDQIIERPETVILTLTGAVNSLISLATSPATPVVATINDNDVPTITSISPVSGQIGNTVTITGTHFSSTPGNNIVFFGPVRAVVSAATGSTLTVTVPSGATLSPISVTCDSLTAYSSQLFNVTFTNGSDIKPTTFAQKFEFSSPGFPLNAAVSDLNGDGYVDMAVINSAGNSVSIFSNNGVGGAVSFAQKIDFPTGSSPNSIKLTDLDGDGKQDMVVTNLNTGVSVFRNNSSEGNISFADKIDYLAGNGSSFAAIADLNLDGKPELIVTSARSDIFSVFANISVDGQINFTDRVDFTAPSQPGDIAVNDFDDDGRADLAVLNVNGNSLSVYKNTSVGGSISFAPGVEYATGINPGGVTIADFDGDGKNDLAVVNGGSNSLSVFRNTSTDGSIAFAATDFSAGDAPSRPSVGDINGDGKPDLAVANFASNTLSVFLNSSSSNAIAFGKVDIPTRNMPNSVSVADANNDGLPDLIVTSGDGFVSVMKNTVDGPVISAFSPAVACPGSTVTITGTNLSNATSVSFGGKPASSFSVISATTITAVFEGGTSGNVEVTTPKGHAALAGLAVLPLPVIIPEGSTTFSPGGKVVLTASTGDGYNYRWSKDGAAIDGVTGVSYTVTQSGTYTVSIITPNCSIVSAPVVVNVVFGLPVTNFKISANSETCRSSNNGSINIAAVQVLNYTVTLSGAGMNASEAFNETTEFTGLAAGVYDVCITVEGQPDYKQCFQVNVTEPQDLAVYTTVDKSGNTVRIVLDGGGSYQIELNGETYKTSGTEITLPLLPGSNSLRVSTDRICQGVVERMITLSEEVLVYPNPFENTLNITLGEGIVSKAAVEIRNLEGKLVHSGRYQTDYGNIQMDLPELVRGMYFLKLSFEGTEKIYKIMKK